MTTALEKLSNYMANNGLFFKTDNFNFDGTKTQLTSSKTKEKNKVVGAVFGHSSNNTQSGNACVICNVYGVSGYDQETVTFWDDKEKTTTGQRSTHQVKQTGLSPEEFNIRQQQRLEQQAKQQAELRVQALREYQQLRCNDNVIHNYLTVKNVIANRGVTLAGQSLKIQSLIDPKKAIYINTGDLIVPFMNINKEFMTYQVISSITGQFKKRQRVDVTTVGAFHPFNWQEGKTRAIFLCEGYSTAASLARVTGSTVFACVDVHNVGVIAQQIRQKFPDIKIIIATDHDRFKKGHMGIRKGLEYSMNLQCPFIFPKFPAESDPTLSDWNDLASIVNDDFIHGMIERQLDTLADQGIDNIANLLLKRYFPNGFE